MSDVFEELKWRKFNVLDKGWVCLVDKMGDDAAIAAAARTSYGEGTRKPSDDETLIRYLMRHKHSSPFECCQIKLQMRLPIFVERQKARHRTAGWNEVSGRYSELPEEFYVPEAEDIKAQSATNKQGRGDSLNEMIVDGFREKCRLGGEHAFEEYRASLSNGVAREVARINLPLSTYTEKVWWINLHNMLHFLALRMAPDAQLEIRQYATIIGEQIVKPLFPATWQAFLDYRLNAMQLTALDIGVIQKLAGENASRTVFRWACPAQWQAERCREREECWEKLVKLGLVSE